MKFTKREYCLLGFCIGGLLAHIHSVWRSEKKIIRLEESLKDEKLRADAMENAAIANKKFYEDLINNCEKDKNE